MNVNQIIVNINSERPEELIRFYRDIVGLEPRFDAVPGSFAAGGEIALIIESHSEVRGPAREPTRAILNLVVDDASAEYRRLEQAGVRFIRSLYEEPGAGLFATFADPDGNLCQLVELRM